MKEIEDTIFDDGMAVNCIVAARRLIELMIKHHTNNLQGVTDPRIRRVMWFLNSFYFGQTATIDMGKEWDEMYEEFKKTITE